MLSHPKVECARVNEHEKGKLRYYIRDWCLAMFFGGKTAEIMDFLLCCVHSFLGNGSKHQVWEQE